MNQKSKQIKKLASILLIGSTFFSTHCASGLVLTTKKVGDMDIDVYMNGILDVMAVFPNFDKKIEDKNVNPVKTVDYQKQFLATFGSLNFGLDGKSEYLKCGGSLGLQLTNFSQRAVSTNIYLRNQGDHFAELRLGSETPMGSKLSADASIYNSKLTSLQNFLPSNYQAQIYDGGHPFMLRDRPGAEKPRMASLMFSTKMGDFGRLSLGGSYIPDSTNVGSMSHNALEFKDHPLVKGLKTSITEAYSLGANIEFILSESFKLFVSASYETGKVNLFLQNYTYDAMNLAPTPAGQPLQGNLIIKEGNFVRLPSDKYKCNDFKSWSFGASIVHENFGIGGSYQNFMDSFQIPGLTTSGTPSVGKEAAPANPLATDNKDFVSSSDKKHDFYTLSFGGFVAYKDARFSVKYDKTSNMPYKNTFQLLELSITYKLDNFLTLYGRCGFVNINGEYESKIKTDKITARLSPGAAAGAAPAVPAVNPAIDPAKVDFSLTAHDTTLIDPNDPASGARNPNGIVDIKKNKTENKATIFTIGAVMSF